MHSPVLRGCGSQSRQRSPSISHSQRIRILRESASERQTWKRTLSWQHEIEIFQKLDWSAFAPAIFPVLAVLCALVFASFAKNTISGLENFNFSHEIGPGRERGIHETLSRTRRFKWSDIEEQIKKIDETDPRESQETHAPRRTVFRPPSKFNHRQRAVVDATKRVWDAYEAHAFGYDELLPLSGRGQNTFGDGLGVTIVDSLDTLYMMGGLDGRYERARNWVERKLHLDSLERISVFEATIRLLGGLTSQFYLSGDSLFLRKAEELGMRLAASFNTPSGLPCGRLSLRDGSCAVYRDNICLAEAASLSLEFRALANISRHPLLSHAQERAEAAVTYVQTALSTKQRLQGSHKFLLPNMLSIKSGKFISETFSVGALGDSYFEYLIKAWLQGGKRERHLWTAFRDFVDALVDVALVIPPNGDVCIADITFNHLGEMIRIPRHQHLSCFLPGSLILGLTGLNSDDTHRRKTWSSLAHNLTITCYNMYNTSITGLASEFRHIMPDGRGIPSGAYNLRPETVEALYYMHRHTQDVRYRDMGWEIFTAMEAHSRTPLGAYAVVDMPHSPRARQLDAGMPSFVISETLKYFYMLFAENDQLPQTRWVLNTEAHPFPIRST